MVTLAFVGGIVAFILLDFFVMAPLDKKRLDKLRKAEEHNDQDPVEVVIPKGYVFGDNHIWAHIRGDGNVSLGADEFLGVALGRISKVETPHAGRHVAKGEVLFSIEYEGKSLSLHSPVSGSVSAINTELEFLPEKIIDDAYREGWVVEIEPDENYFDELSKMKRGEAAADWMHEEMHKVATWIDEHAPKSGLEALLENTTPENWESFSSQFLEMPAQAEG